MRWHVLFESLAYLVAFRLYAVGRARSGDFLHATSRGSIVVAAILGAAAGAKILYWFENPALTWQHWQDIPYLLGGKTIVGALAGGTLAVEWTKQRLGLVRRTGDLFAIPIAVGVAIGRVGCFLAGKADDTYGVATMMPWGIDLGDGVRRHPVDVYEVLFALLLAVALRWVRQPAFAEGDRFRTLIFTYYAWRLGIDFLKPEVRFGGLTTIQWVCAAGVLWYARDMLRMARQSIDRTIEVTPV